VNWKRFEYVEIKTKNGVKKKLTLVDKTTKPGEMITYLKKVLEFFPGHHFRSKWQTDQLKHLVQNLPQNDCLTVHDFSENYRCSEQIEIQSNYFQRTEVPIHVSLIYRLLEVDGVSSTQDDPYIICEHFYVISTYEKHDHHFVKHVQKLISDYLQSISYPVCTMHEFCDGCQAQYKSRNCFGSLVHSVKELGYKKIVRNFFESSHGKGPHDAAGGLLKNQADMAVIHGKAQIRSAIDLFDFAESNLRSSRSHNCKRRIFRYVEEMQRSEECFQPVKGIRAVHRAETSDNGNIILRNISCYCDSCIEEEGDCENCFQVGLSTEINMKSIGEPSNIDFDGAEQDDIEIEKLSDFITEGTAFAVLCTGDDSNDFYLLKATSKSTVLRKSKSDRWGGSFTAGSSIIYGKYFAKKENSILEYQLIKRPTAIVPSASVLYLCQNVSLKNDTL
jgi:hypothetical protein